MKRFIVGILVGACFAGTGAAYAKVEHDLSSVPPVQHFECSDYYGNGYTITVHRFHSDKP